MLNSDTMKLFEEGTLLRIDAIKPRGKRLHLIGRVLQLDLLRDVLMVCEVDIKKVEILSLNEIEDVFQTA